MLCLLFNSLRLAVTSLPLYSVTPSTGITLRLTRTLRRRAAATKDEKLQLVDEALLPKVALVGRPNVGKSALFNRLLRRRVALVYDTPEGHVTRDYQEGRARLGDLVFRAADTSGLEPRTSSCGDTIHGRATALTAKLLRQSHVTLMVIDAKQGVLPADEELAGWLRRQVDPDSVVLVANKGEGAKAREEMPQTVYDCYRLGFGEPVAVSATTGEGLADLYTALQPHIDRITAELQLRAPAAVDKAAEEPTSGASARSRRALFAPAEAEVGAGDSHTGAHEAAPGDDSAGSVAASREEGGRLTGRLRGGNLVVEEEAEGGKDLAQEEAAAEGAAGRRFIKLAIMGLPNAGKSTLLNRLLGEERALTGPEPGLTRDAVRASWLYGDQPVELIDTAGWVGKGLTGRYDDVGGDLAAMSRAATLRSLAQVHVALLVVDAEKALRNEKVLVPREVALAHMVVREGKALVIVANKADLLNRQQRTTYLKSLRRQLSERFLDAGVVPIVEVSAREGTGVADIMPAVVGVHEAWNKRVTTSRLNRFVSRLAVRMVGSGLEASLARVRFLAQVKARPPTFAAFLRGSRRRAVDRSFSVFLANQIREVMGFQGVPVRLYVRYRESRAEYLRRVRTSGLAETGSDSGAGEAAEQGPFAAATGAKQAGSPATSRRVKLTAQQPGLVLKRPSIAPAGGAGGSGAGSIMALALRRAAELSQDSDEGGSSLQVHDRTEKGEEQHTARAASIAGEDRPWPAETRQDESEAPGGTVGARRRGLPRRGARRISGVVVAEMQDEAGAALWEPEDTAAAADAATAAGAGPRTEDKTGSPGVPLPQERSTPRAAASGAASEEDGAAAGATVLGQRVSAADQESSGVKGRGQSSGHDMGMHGRRSAADAGGRDVQIALEEASGRGGSADGGVAQMPGHRQGLEHGWRWEANGHAGPERQVGEAPGPGSALSSSSASADAGPNSSREGAREGMWKPHSVGAAAAAAAAAAFVARGPALGGVGIPGKEKPGAAGSPGTGKGSEPRAGAGVSKKALLFRALLTSRKPSVPLSPVRPPAAGSGSKKQKKATQVKGRD